MVSLLALIDYFSQSVPSAVPPLPAVGTLFEPQGPVAPQKEAVYPLTLNGQPVRDPFLPPPGYEAPTEKSTAAPSANNGVVPAAGTVLPPPADSAAATPVGAVAVSGGTGNTGDQDAQGLTLLGVVGSSGNRSPILRYGGTSRSYGVGEQVGEYQIVAVSDHSVTLQSNSDRKVLTVHE